MHPPGLGARWRGACDGNAPSSGGTAGAQLAPVASPFIGLRLVHRVYTMCAMSLAQTCRALLGCGKLCRGRPVILLAMPRQAKRRGVVTRTESVILSERFPLAVRTAFPSSLAASKHARAVISLLVD